MNILYIITCIIGIVFMCVCMFIGIWLLVIAHKTYRQFRYKNYILEKISENISNSNKLTEINNPSSLQDSLDFFDLSVDKNKIDNIKNFGK